MLLILIIIDDDIYVFIYVIYIMQYARFLYTRDMIFPRHPLKMSECCQAKSNGQHQRQHLHMKSILNFDPHYFWCKMSLVGPLPRRKRIITHWDIRRRILMPTSLYCSCVRNLNESPWAGSSPTQILCVTMHSAGGGINFLFSVFMLFFCQLWLLWD